MDANSKASIASNAQATDKSSGAAGNDGNDGKKSFIEDFKRRVDENTTGRWIRFGIVTLIFFAWVAWLGNWWFALLFILLFDIYITGYIPFTWWKKSKNKYVRSVMSWVDAIVYALVLVYFIFAFLGQNYMIPSSSLEKTLLTGDYLLVNKVTYGPRVPITPVNFPLVHNKMPILGTDSYLDAPQNSYRRLKGLRSVETGDIVVFNFPAGDTVATKYEEICSYYDLVKGLSENGVDGREIIKNNPDRFGEIKYRPVDRRTNYVKRAVGLPGETLRIKNDTIYIDGVAQEYPENVQFNYFIALSRALSDQEWHHLGVTAGDVANITQTEFVPLLTMHGFPSNSVFYNVPLTADMIAQLQQKGVLNKAEKYSDFVEKSGQIHGMRQMGEGQMYAADIHPTWSVSNWGGQQGVLIPAKGTEIPLTYENWVLYERPIRNYEGHTNAYWDAKQHKAIIDGNPADTYTFSMDYYFMMGDNRDNSLDSRFWGFVPEDHIVGTPLFILASFDKDRSIFNGGIRWNRIFRDANPDK